MLINTYQNMKGLSLCQFRIGILPLKIETGRFKNIRDNITGQYRRLRPDERTCEICHNNEIEDEFHFLCVCREYSIPRDNLFLKVEGKYREFQDLDLRGKFNFMMTNCNLEVGKYLKQAWEIRKSTLYTGN